MKPLNLNTGGCDPISSNCVIWQGPDIPCIKLCKGDTVSDVVFKLATELCDVLTALDIDTYHLPEGCFVNPRCNPTDFKELIQQIINKLCCIQSNVNITNLVDSCTDGGIGLSGTTNTGGGGTGSRVSSSSSSGCPNCEVPIASCFQYVNEFGDTVTTMQLVDYERAIGNKLCDIVNQILVTNQAISELDERVTALENTPAPVVILPKVTPTCVITPAMPMDMNIVLSALEQQFCQLASITDTPSNLSKAIARECVDLSNSYRLSLPTSNMSTIPGWIVSSATLANSLNNMWLSICDIRTAVRTIQLNCCPSGCDGIVINMNASLNISTITIWFSGTLPSGFQECNPSGNSFTVSDSLGNSITLNIQLPLFLNSPTGYVYDLGTTPINTAANITISSDACFKDESTNTTCQFCISYTLLNQSICPELTVTPTVGAASATISFIPSAVPANYTIEVWNSTFSAIVATQTANILTSGEKVYTISGLSFSTVYNVRLIINSGGKETVCGYTTFTTDPFDCEEPFNVTANISLPVLCEMCGPAVEFVDNITVDGTYVDLTSQYLVDVTGGVINDFFATEDTAVATASGGRTSFNTVVVNGKLYVGTSTGNIEVWENPTTGATQVAGSPFATGATNINDMCYDPATGLIFMTHNNGTQIGSFNPGTYVAVLNIAATGGSGCFIHNNPVSGEKYVYGNIASYPVKIYSSGTTPAFVTSVTGGTVPFSFNMQPKYIEFNPVTGEAWVMCQDLAPTGLQDIVVIGAGPTYTPVSIPNTMAPYYPVTGSPLGNTKTLAYYPGDGTVGTDRMFACYRDPGTLTTQVTELITTAPYTATVFSTNAGVNSYSNILYSSVYNKLCLFLNSSFFVFDPTDNTLGFNTGLTVPNNAMWPYEDVTNELIFVNSTNAGPSDNLFWYGPDLANVTFCSEGIVKMYLGSQGPFQFDTTNNIWVAMCSSILTPSTPGPGYFTVSANLSGSILSAALIYSNDYGLTWNSLNDTSGNLYANGAAWLLGRVYPNQTPTTYYKVAFVTNTNCGLEGPLMT